MREPSELEQVLQHGIDLRARRIYLQGDIDEESAARVIRGIHLISSSEAGKAAPRPISLVLSSYGGSIDAAFAIHDAVQISPAPIHVLAMGICCSAAPLILACGAKRQATANTEFMLHPASMESEGQPGNVASNAESVIERCKAMNKLLARYTYKLYSFWSKFDRGHDRFFTAEEAREWGLIDEIL